MEIKSLKSFVTVAALNSFSAAAKALHTVQPNISRQISELEKQLDTKLFTRSTHHVELTEKGKLLLPEAIAILENNQRIINLMKQKTDKPNTLNIGYLASACSAFLPQLINEFSQTYPDVKISLLEMTSHQQSQALTKHQIDVSFARPFPKSQEKQVHSTTLYTDSLVAVIPLTHALSSSKKINTKELKHESFILFGQEEANTLHNQIIQICKKNGFSPNITSHPENMRNLLTTVAAGLGISIVPNCASYLGVNGCRFIPISDIKINVKLNMYHKKNITAEHIQHFIELCQLSSVDMH